MSASLKIEITPGASIERACEDAQRVAELLQIMVEFDFNMVRCVADPGGSADLLASRQQLEQARPLTGPLDRRFASSHPRGAK